MEVIAKLNQGYHFLNHPVHLAVFAVGDDKKKGNGR